jgi:hypothetical protein
MEPETRRVYEELHSYETEFRRDPDPEPPSRAECRMQVCMYLIRYSQTVVPQNPGVM